MNWNYVATFTGTGPIANLPTGTLDKKRENLWVMWGGTDHAILYFKHALSQNGTSFSGAPARVNTRITECSPCLVWVNEQLVTLYVEGGYLEWGVLHPEAKSLEYKSHLVVRPVDGALAAFFPTNSLFVATRGEQHSVERPAGEWSDLYYTNLVELGTANAHDLPRPPLPFKSSNPDSLFRSYYSPAVATMPNGEIAVLFKGTGRPHSSSCDYELYFTSAPDPAKPVFLPAELVKYPVPGKSPNLATTMNRPSLALHGKDKAATLVALYSGMNTGTLDYLVGTPIGSRVTWEAPPQNGTSDGTVPLDDLLAEAGPGGSAVKLKNPVAVWVNAPDPSNTLFLLVGEQSGDTIAGPLYLIRYMGHT
jgi:hypothetical protein